MNEAVIAILAAVVGAIVTAALGVLAWAALRLFRDVKGISARQSRQHAENHARILELKDHLMCDEGSNPAMRREDLRRIK